MKTSRNSLVRWVVAAALGALFVLSLPHLIVFVGPTRRSSPRVGTPFSLTAKLEPRARSLSNAIVAGSGDVFEYGRQLGYLQTPHPLLPLFDEVWARPDAALILEDVLACGDTVAQLYAMALLRDLDRDAYSRWADEVGVIKEQVMITDGCVYGSKRRPREILNWFEGGLTFAPPSD